MQQPRRHRHLPAFAFAVCGGLVVLYVFFVVVGTVNLGRAAESTAAAGVLTVIWLFGFWRRIVTGAALVQRPDRERRGF